MQPDGVDAEAMAVEVDAVDFPDENDDRKDEATRCDCYD